MELSGKTVPYADRSRHSPVPVACLFANSPARLTSSFKYCCATNGRGPPAPANASPTFPQRGWSRRPYLRNSGDSHVIASTMRSVPTPPETTETIGPKKLATRPDSNAPSSFDVPINREFRADTRPRILSGVRTCTRVDRTTTLMLSQEPSRQSIAIESQKFREIPNTTVTVPKPATATNRVRPALLK